MLFKSLANPDNIIEVIQYDGDLSNSDDMFYVPVWVVRAYLETNELNYRGMGELYSGTKVVNVGDYIMRDTDPRSMSTIRILPKKLVDDMFELVSPDTMTKYLSKQKQK